MDRLAPEERSRIMSRIRARDTKPELIVRRRLHAAGLRFRLHRRDLPGRPDLVFPRHRIALFVHGCFWHGCPICDRGRRQPASNTEFWAKKLAANRARDEAVGRQLEEAGWRVMTVWECQIRRSDDIDRALAPVLALARSCR